MIELSLTNRFYTFSFENIFTYIKFNYKKDNHMLKHYENQEVLNWCN